MYISPVQCFDAVGRLTERTFDYVESCASYLRGEQNQRTASQVMQVYMASSHWADVCECVCVCVCVWPVNGEPRLRHESSEVRQLRSELLMMRDKVEQLINRLQLSSFTATTSATVATDNDAVSSNGW